MESRFNDLLSKNGYRITVPRRHVFEVLKKSHEPLSIVELKTRLSGEVDSVSVYRAVDLFTKLGITTILSHGWKQRYELASPFRPHHHHLVCTSCGKATEIHSKRIESLITLIAKEESFIPLEHIFEINGQCKNCHSN